MPRNKKYTQFTFDRIKDPDAKELYGNLGDMYQLFTDLTEIRLKRNLTQHQLSEKSGVTQPALARIEAGRANPTLAQLVKILTALNCELKIDML